MYTANNLAPGSYTITFVTPAPYVSQQYYPGTVDYAGNASVAVVAGQTTTANDALVAGGTITGTVRNAGGNALPNIAVQVGPASGASTSVFAQTAADGTYTVTRVAPGNQTAYFSDPAGTYAFQYYNQQTLGTGAATPIPVAAGQTSAGIDATLAVGGTIAGTVTDTGGTPLANIWVYSYPVGATSGITFGAGATTAADGTYTVRGLASASYDVQFSDPAGTYATQAYNNATTYTAVTNVAVVAPNAVTGIGDRLVVGGKISGTVTDASGQPVANLGVEAFDYTQAVSSGSTTTAADGTYTVGGLATGNYTVDYYGGSIPGGSVYYKNTPDFAAATPVAVTAGHTTPGIDENLGGAGCTPTATSLGSSANPASVGQTVTFTATVTASAGGTPTGQVTFTDGTTTLGTTPVDASGQATLNVASLGIGSHSITASYGGDNTYAVSTSTPLSQAIEKAATTTGLTSSANPTTAGDSVTFTATVSPQTSVGGPTPTGQVSFTDGSTTLATAALDAAGKVTFTLSTLSAGTHVIAASYLGDATYSGSTANTVSQTVNPVIVPIATTTALALSANPIAFGTLLTLTAVVTPTSDLPRGTPTGTITFTDGATVLAAKPVDTAGAATYTTSTLAVGAHQINAVFTSTATFAGSSSGTQTETVIQPTPGLIVTVQDSHGSPLANATVAVVAADGTATDAGTGPDGTAKLLGLADGNYTVAAFAAGFLPGDAATVVAASSGKVTITLAAGPLAAAILSSSELTPSQMVQDGIDPTDPANSNVFQFVVDLPGVGTLCGFTNATGLLSGNAPAAAHCSISVGGGGGGGSFSSGGTSYTVTGSGNQIGILATPGVSFLKQFFDVRLTVLDLAAAPFSFSQGQATLALPAGLSLAPSVTLPQSATVSVPNITGGGSQSVDWLLRGDAEGFYNLTANYHGMLQPFANVPVDLTATTSTPIHVWGGSALRMIVQADSAVYAHYPYRVRIGLQNLADIPVYNAAVALAPQTGQPQYIFQPRQTLAYSTAQIDPGQTWWTDDYELLSPNTTAVDLTKAVVSQVAGNVVLSSTVIAQTPLYTPQTAPKITGVGLVNAASLTWDPIPGATGYEIFTTPTDLTPFSTTPTATVAAANLTATVPATGGTTAWYAVTAIVNGHEQMSHPMISVQALAPVAPSFIAPTPANGSTISVRRGVRVNLTVAAAEATSGDSITLHETGPGGAVFTSQPGNPARGQLTWVPHTNGQYPVTISATNTEGLTTTVGFTLQAGPVAPSGRYVALGDSVPYGLGLSLSSKNDPPSRQAYPFLVDTELGLRPLVNRSHSCDLGGGVDDLAINGAPSQSNPWVTGDGKCRDTVIADEVPSARLSAAPPTLVTIQAGADDLNFGGCLEALAGFPSQAGADRCYTIDRHGKIGLTPTATAELSFIKQGITETIDTVRGAAPNARIMLLDYYQIVPTANHFQAGPSTGILCAALAGTGAKLRQHREVGDYVQRRLNAALRQVAQSRPGVYFVDITNVMSGHEICTSNPWEFDTGFNATTAGIDGHPTAVGQAAIADVVVTCYRSNGARCTG